MTPSQPPGAPSANRASRYPETPKRPVVDTYQGSVKVTDDYRWLEQGDDPEVVKWTSAQSRYTRAVLDGLPSVRAIRERLTALMHGRSADYFDLQQEGAALFALKIEPPKEQPILIMMSSVDLPEASKVILDPNELDKTGKTAIDFYVPSRDGKRCAVSISRGGSERGDVHFYETNTGKRLPDVIPRVNGGTAGGSVAWNADGTGVYYTRYPKEGERPPADLDFYQQVYFHELGTPQDHDRYMIGKEFPRIAEIKLEASPDGRQILATVANGDGGEFAHYLLTTSKEWKQLSQFSDMATLARFGRDGRIYMLTRLLAPRGKIVRLLPGSVTLAASETMVPESEATIESFVLTDGRLHVVDLLGGPSQIRIFDLKGHAQGQVTIPAVASVAQLTHLGREQVLARIQTFVDPPAWYRYSGAEVAVKSPLFMTSPADFSDTEVVRETCKSRDGTLVPMSIVRRQGTTLDRRNPTLLYGYGGFGVSKKPQFGEWFRIWLEQGGVLAHANLRGGGEFGEGWHKAGNLLNKQNVFDDFAACAQHLIDAGYTSSDKLAILGGSNGGLLMGAMITQHPELFRAVVARVGIYDMLRVEQSPNGAFNVTEYGTVKDPAQFKALHAYSPYHHVNDGTAYPAVLLTVGLNDPRVDPWQSRKMAARLQAASASKAPVLLLASGDSGHGVGSSLSEAIQREADAFAFLFHELGVPYKPPAGRSRPREER